MTVRLTKGGHVVEQHSPMFSIDNDDEGNCRITFEGDTETVIVHLTDAEAVDLIGELGGVVDERT